MVLTTNLLKAFHTEPRDRRPGHDADCRRNKQTIVQCPRSKLISFVTNSPMWHHCLSAPPPRDEILPCHRHRARPLRSQGCAPPPSQGIVASLAVDGHANAAHVKGRRGQVNHIIASTRIDRLEADGTRNRCSAHTVVHS